MLTYAGVGREDKKVTNNPSLSSPAFFKWSGKNHGFFKTEANKTMYDFNVDGIKFSGSFGAPVHWDKFKRGENLK